MRSSKFIIISFIVLIMASGLFFYTSLRNQSLNNNIESLELKTKGINDSIRNNQNEKEKLEQEYSELNEKVKDKVDEYNIWLKMKEKIEK